MGPKAEPSRQEAVSGNPATHALDQYILIGHDRREPLWARYTRRTIQACLDFAQVTDLDTLSPVQVAAWLASDADQYAKSTQRKRFIILRAFLRWAHGEGILEVDPTVRVRPPPGPGHQAIRFLDPAAVVRLLRISRSPHYEMVALAVYAGLRLGEIRHLQWEDLRGGQQGGLIEIRGRDEWRPKRGRERIIPVHHALVRILDEYWQMEGGPTGGLLFPGRSQGGTRDGGALLRWLKRAGKRASISPPPTWYDLRHTFASWLVQEGVSIYIVSKFLGHASVRTTEKHYADLAPERLHSQVNRLPIH